MTTTNETRIDWTDDGICRSSLPTDWIHVTSIYEGGGYEWITFHAFCPRPPASTSGPVVRAAPATTGLKACTPLRTSRAETEPRSPARSAPSRSSTGTSRMRRWMRCRRWRGSGSATERQVRHRAGDRLVLRAARTGRRPSGRDTPPHPPGAMSVPRGILGSASGRGLGTRGPRTSGPGIVGEVRSAERCGPLHFAPTGGTRPVRTGRNGVAATPERAHTFTNLEVTLEVTFADLFVPTGPPPSITAGQRPASRAGGI